jgi:hypothetical protein
MPVILLDDVVGSAGVVSPAQIDNAVPNVNVGVIFGFTVTDREVVVAH